MIIAEEQHLPVKLSRRHVFLRIDIDQKIDFKALSAVGVQNITPILVKNYSDVHPMGWNQAFFDEIIEQYRECAQKLIAAGFNKLVIGADSDSILQKILSPRFSSRDLHERKKTLIQLFLELKKICPDVVVLLTVEELAPGGFDATDGIAIAKELETLGLKEIIAASGTKDFMPLYDRRTTQKKQSDHHDFLSHEPSLASCLWLLNNTNLRVWCSAYINNEAHAVELARALNLAGLIEKAPIKDI